MIDPDYVWSVLGDNGGCEKDYGIDTRVEVFWEVEWGHTTFRVPDMHMVTAVKVRINGRQVKRFADRLARTPIIPIVRSTPQPSVGRDQLLKGRPFVSHLNLLGKPA